MCIYFSQQLALRILQVSYELCVEDGGKSLKLLGASCRVQVFNGGALRGDGSKDKSPQLRRSFCINVTYVHFCHQVNDCLLLAVRCGCVAARKVLEESGWANTNGIHYT